MDFLEKFKMSVSCSICQEHVNFYDEEISVLNCGHLYHQSCLQRWLDTSSTCPECRTAVAGNNFVQKIYPSKSKSELENAVYKGSSNETKNILKEYEDTTKNLQKMFTERIEDLEKENLKLKEDLEKLLIKKNLVDNKNAKLTRDLEKCLDEKDVFEEENERLNFQVEQLKSCYNYLKDYELQNKKHKKCLTSAFELTQDCSSNSNSEITLSSGRKS